ncbi:MAG: OmpA family protein [Bacteroidota bacterium]
MSFNLFESAKEMFSGSLMQSASSMLGESQHTTQKAMDGIIPTMIGSLIGKSESHEGANQLFSLIQDTRNEDVGPGNISSLLGDSSGLLSKGTGLLSSLFGNKTDGVANAISQFSGVKQNSALTLLSLAAPAILGFLGKKIKSEGLGTGGLATLLSSQSGLLSKYMPAGLGSILGTLGIGNVFNSFAASSPKPQVVKPSYDPPPTVQSKYDEPSGGGRKWLWPLLLLAGAALVWYLFGMKGCNQESATAVTTDTLSPVETTVVEIPSEAKGTVDSVSGDYVYNLGKMVSFDLPNGVGKLEVGENSTEARLINFLNDNNATIDTAKGNWFEFTNVKFKTGSSSITDESMTQLKNLVLISKAYPAAQFRIGGYTDNTGNAASNISLSQKRAEIVLATLSKLGIAKASLAGAKGYGPEFPVGDNNTAEGRAMNRRVAVNVKAK